MQVCNDDYGYATYITIYNGDKLPPLYIGSSSVERIRNGYLGSVSSKKYSDIFKSECKHNPDLFDIVILDTFKTRKEATKYELLLHKMHNVVVSERFINMSLATVDGHHGRDVSGANHPLYGKSIQKGWKHYHHPTTKERSFGPVCPDGYVIGRYNPKSDCNKDRKWFHDPNTNECRILHECPNGWIKGRPQVNDWQNKTSRKGKKNKSTLSCPIRNEPFRSTLKSIWIEIGRPKATSLIKECHIRGYEFVKSRSKIDSIISEFCNE